MRPSTAPGSRSWGSSRTGSSSSSRAWCRKSASRTWSAPTRGCRPSFRSSSWAAAATPTRTSSCFTPWPQPTRACASSAPSRASGSMTCIGPRRCTCIPRSSRACRSRCCRRSRSGCRRWSATFPCTGSCSAEWRGTTSSLRRATSRRWPTASNACSRRRRATASSPPVPKHTCGRSTRGRRSPIARGALLRGGRPAAAGRRTETHATGDGPGEG